VSTGRWRASEFVELKQEPWLFSSLTLTGARLGLCCEADDRYGARPGTLVKDSSDSGASSGAADMFVQSCRLVTLTTI
jgi:hypothetical protein